MSMDFSLLQNSILFTNISGEGVCSMEINNNNQEHNSDLAAFKSACAKIHKTRPIPIRPRGTDNARVINVIETQALIGTDTDEDPVRYVMQYWDFDGKLLAAYDTYFDANIREMLRGRKT